MTDERLTREQIRAYAAGYQERRAKGASKAVRQAKRLAEASAKRTGETYVVIDGGEKRMRDREHRYDVLPLSALTAGGRVVYVTPREESEGDS